MYYLDTSILVTAFTGEPAARRVTRWLETSTSPFAISEWVIAEFSSALGSKLRAKELTPAEQIQVKAAFGQASASFEIESVTRADFRAAAALCERSELGLRAPDALHAALCRRLAYTLCTLDKTLAAAAEAIGVPVEQP